MLRKLMQKGRHPFAVEARFDRVVALSFAFPETVLRPLVPPELALDTHNGLGFVTVALVWTRELRPAGLPGWLGRDFFLAGYRVFTRFREPGGRTLRGLKILRSETDSWSMVSLGNWLTGYGYQQVTAEIATDGSETKVRTTLPNGTPTLHLVMELTPAAERPLPPGSPFRDWREARRFAGPMPFTFSPLANGSMVVVEGSRQHWEPRPVEVKAATVALFEEEPFRHCPPILANAFAVEDVPYHWSAGRLFEKIPSLGADGRE